MKKLTCMIAGASLMAIAGVVSAEPVTLTDTQMDGINAGALVLWQGEALAESGAVAVSNLLGLTATTAVVQVTPLAGFVGAAGESQSVAVSSFALGSPVNGAVAASGSESAAALF